MKVIVFDTETTGLPKSRYAHIQHTWLFPYVVQLSWLVYDTGKNKIEKVEDHIIRLPEHITIPEESMKIHGITNEKMQEEGKLMSVVLKRFLRDLSNSKCIIAHNIEFDKKILDVECFREQYKLLSNYRKKEFCTMKNSIHTCKILKKNHEKFKSKFKFPKLIELHEKLFESKPNNLHNALIDILVCFRCFYKLKFEVDILNVNNKFRRNYKKYCGL